MEGPSNLIRDILKSNKYVPYLDTIKLVNDIKIKPSNSVEYTITSTIESICHDIKNDIHEVLKKIYHLSLKGFYIAQYDNISDVIKPVSSFVSKKSKTNVVEKIKNAKDLASLNTNLVGEIITLKYITSTKSHLLKYNTEDFKIIDKGKKLKLISFFHNVLNNSFKEYYEYINYVVNSLKSRTKTRFRSRNTKKMANQKEKQTRKKSIPKMRTKTIINQTTYR